MNKTIVLSAKIFTALVMVLGIIYTLITMFRGEDLKGNLELQKQILNPFFIITLIVFIIAIIGSIVFPLINIFSSPKAALRLAVALGFLALVYFISWALADGNISADFYAKNNIDEFWSRMIGAAIYIVYILGGISILAIFVSGIIGLTVKR